MSANFSFASAQAGLIIGASSEIAKNISEKIINLNPEIELHLVSTRSIEANHFHLVQDYNEMELENIAKKISTKLSFVIICNGFLHDEENSSGGMPEKSLRNFSIEWAIKNFSVNTFITPLVAKLFHRHFDPKAPSLFVAFSAKVGSISDNELGGWHSYRASKAALNMYLKTIALEWRLAKPNMIVAAYHPGTVDTSLSKPFHKVVKHEIFTPEVAATHFINVFNEMPTQKEALFVSWNQQQLPW